MNNVQGSTGWRKFVDARLLLSQSAQRTDNLTIAIVNSCSAAVSINLRFTLLNEARLAAVSSNAFSKKKTTATLETVIFFPVAKVLHRTSSRLTNVSRVILFSEPLILIRYFTSVERFCILSFCSRSDVYLS